MSSRDLARRARVEISFDGKDITSSIRPYFNSLTYTDNQEDEADDLSLSLEDSDSIWMEQWLTQIVNAAASQSDQPAAAETPATVSVGSSGDDVRKMQSMLVAAGYSLPVSGVDGIFGAETRAAVIAYQQDNGLAVDGICGPETWGALLGTNAAASAAAGLAISAVIIRQNWNGQGEDEILDCGQFTLDKVDYSGPPATLKISATALPFTSGIRQTAKCKAWEAYHLSGIANEMAAMGGMNCMYLSTSNPYYERVEQYQTSDIEFLKQLCHDAGCALKATNKMIVIFDQADYESRPAVRIVKKGNPEGAEKDGYTKFKLSMSTADSQYQACRVWYNDPASGSCIEGWAYDESYDESKDDNQTLEINQRVATIGEAQTLAEKNLRLHNKFAREVQFTFPGDPALMAGLCLELEGWGGWSGSYIITQSKHTVKASGGYQTVVNARRKLEGY